MPITNLTEASSYDDVRQLEATDAAQGGPGAIMNAQAQALTNRTKWLKDQILNINPSIINSLSNGQISGLAQAFGAGSVGTAVVMSGMTISHIGSTWFITAGWGFYNNNYFFCPGTISGIVLGFGETVQFTMNTVNGLPTLSMVGTFSPVVGASKFTPSELISWLDELNILLDTALIDSRLTTLEGAVTTLQAQVLTLQGQVSTLNSEVAVSSWIDLTLVGSGWTAGTGHNKPQYRVDGMGRVYVRGVFIAGAGAGITIFSLPLGAYSPNFMNVCCWGFTTPTTFAAQFLSIDISGDVGYGSAALIPGTGTWVDICGIPPFFNN